jgi:hypothetical protein
VVATSVVSPDDDLMTGGGQSRVVLDGCGLLALVDTGSAGSMINGRGLDRLGLTPTGLARDPVAGMAGVNGRLQARRHWFGEFRIGPVIMARPEFLVSGVLEGGFKDCLKECLG